MEGCDATATPSSIGLHPQHARSTDSQLAHPVADLLVVHILRYQPLPFCDGVQTNSSTSHGWIPCTAAAPFSRQVLLAVVLLLASPLVVRIASSRRAQQQGMPSIVGMCVGWILGDALVQLVQEGGERLVPKVGVDFGQRAASNVLLTAVATLGGAALLMVLERMAVRLRMLAALRLPSEALMTAIMAAWAFTFRSLILAGLSIDPDGPVRVHARCVHMRSTCAAHANARRTCHAHRLEDGGLHAIPRGSRCACVCRSSTVSAPHCLSCPSSPGGPPFGPCRTHALPLVARQRLEPHQP